MAMEKLILRSVMYGVDKIPDSWFEKVPGGFYKASQKADDRLESEKGDSKKHRRYSHHGDDPRRTRRDRYEDEVRAHDRKRHERRGRSSYDSSHDDDPRGGDRRRRRHSTEGDRKHHSERQPRPTDPYFDERQRPVTSESSRAINPSSSKRAAAAEAGVPRSATFPAKMPSPPMKRASPVSPSRPQSSSTPNNYVPYAHIYGSPGSEQRPAGGRAFTGYENQPPYPDYPRSPRATDRYSPTYASYDTRRDSNVQRSRSERRPDRYQGKAPYVDPQAPLHGQAGVPPPPPGPPPGTTSKDPRRDSAQDRDYRHGDHRANDRGYTSD